MRYSNWTQGIRGQILTHLNFIHKIEADLEGKVINIVNFHYRFNIILKFCGHGYENLILKILFIKWRKRPNV